MLLKLRAVKLKSIVLTFDDGPGNKLTPIILHTLNEHKAKATFFLLGRNIPGRGKIVRQIAEQGHEIGSHGYDHLNHWKISPIRAIKDINRGWQAIDDALGVNRRKYLFRPPYGKLNVVSLLYLLLCRIPIVYWSVDLEDTWMTKPAPQRIAVLAKRAGGAVSLAHDFDRSDDSVDSLVPESTRSALSMAEEEGMRVLTVSQLLGQSK